MYLKAIEIMGFKSFADKTRLDFEPGITCVVGPNGCGKSNVVDSIRWAIGEMSWKELRSASMVDIIFNGTNKRAPLNMAQVSMIFDNAARQLPLDFNEITVTRKIFRSGESEYYLNKVQCRLRDIRDLFLDTGIGGESYAIIDQGGIGRVLAATPEERRDMFEEVAGVSKYKAKREECIKRLERVDLDLARLSDTVALLAEQIKKLDSEAKKARLYQKYREELKESEIAISVCSIKEADAQIAKHNEALTPVVGKMGDLENRISAQEGAAAALELNLTHKEKEMAEFTEKIAACKYQVGLLEGALTNCDNLTAELTAQIASSGAESARGKNRLQELAPILTKLKEQVAAITQELTPLQEQFNDKQTQARQAEDALRQAEIDTQRTANEMMDLVRKQMEVSNKISLEESSAARENEDLITAEKAAQTQTAELEALQKTLKAVTLKVESAQKTADGARENVQQKESKLRSLQEQRTALSEQLSAVKSARAAAAAKLEMIQTQGKKDPYWVGTKAVSEHKIAGVKGTLRKALKYPAALRVAVEESFGKYLDAVLCADEKSLQAALDVLNKTEKARAKFIVLSKVPKPAGKMANPSLAAELKYPTELTDLVNLLVGEYAYEKGQLQGHFFVGAGDAGVRAPEAYWGEEETVRTELDEHAAQEEKISSQIITNYEALTQADTQLKELRTKVQEAALALNSAQNEATAQQRAADTLRQTIERSTAHKQEIVLHIETRKNAVNTLKENLGQLKTQHAQAAEKSETLKKTQQTLRTQNEELKAQLNALNTQLYEIRIKKNNVELDLKSTTFEFNSLTDSEGKRNQQIASSNARLKSLAEEKVATQAKLSSQRDALAQLELAEHKMRGELEALKKELSDKNTALNQSKKEFSELTIQKNDLENALSNARRQRTTIANNLLESWNITPEEAQMNYGDKTVDYERVKMMRKRIENMGAVNMTAPEEYDALTDRYNFLRSQISDLETAKKDLKSAIQKINQTTRESFKFTFEQVRMHFKNIFQSLFRGGECDLILTDPENLLETGIEIHARPPETKLHNIKSLSGGEKALTALSLLFAFFTHHPSPFCILDETDAPLDEANVERYVNLIKEFSKTTQFIMVTHNKRTMESGQMLYGITMEESGVSKVMSVNLSERSAAATQNKQTIEAMAEA